MTTTSPLTILHCLAPAPVGGLESVVRALALGHRARGHRVIIAAVVDTPDHPFVQALQRDGIETVALQIASRDYRRERKAIATIIESKQPNVVHAHGYRPDILDLAVARRHGVPTVTTMHGFTGGDWKLRLYERLQIRSIRHADAVIAVSRTVYERLRVGGVPSHHLHLVRNAYAPPAETLTRAEARAALNIPEQDFRIAWIGRLSAEKGADVMIETLGELRDLPITLSLIGDGPDLATCLARTKALGISDRLVSHGVVPNAAAYLPAFDLFALSSRTEGTPIIVLEAMAATVPIIATAVGGVPDMLSNDEAILVDAENPQKLAAAIRAVYADPNAARIRATHARQRLDRDFNADAWLSQYESIYQSIQ